MAGKRKTIFVKSVWVMLSIFFALLFTLVAVGASITSENTAAINAVLGVQSYEKIQLGDGNEDMEHFKSDYVKKNANGGVQYTTDANGYKHQVYDHAAMRANSEKVGEQTAVEGSVLLWNNNETLPLAAGSRVSAFGLNSVNYLYLGRGSGGMAVDPVEDSLLVALKNKGLSLNSSLNAKYLQLLSNKSYGRSYRTQSNRDRWFTTGEAPWSEISTTVNNTIANYGDAAIMVVSRNAGEGYDISNNITDTTVDGSSNHLQLTVEEGGILQELNSLKSQGKVKKIVLLLNMANPLEFSRLKDSVYGVDVCVWVGMGGTMSFVQIADVLSGKNYVVSGKSPDTLAYNNYSAPSYSNFGDFGFRQYSNALPDLDKEYSSFYGTFNSKYIVYQEGIYVGYRYYETRYEDYVLGNGSATSTKGSTGGGAWDYSKEVAYTFGYGGSYTTFQHSGYSVTETEDAYKVSMNIKNSGTKYAGKDVLQVYLQKPYTPYDKANNIEKAAVELAGFAKTGVLEPGADETLTVTVPKEELKTYDAYGKKTYILEAGNYYLAAGTDAHNALNNILAAKDLTTAQKARMDDAGNANMAHKITIAADDYVTYSKSLATKKTITNRMDDADINIYEGTADQHIQYLTRNDWGTYPTTAAILDCTNDKMVRDMQYGHEVPVNAGDKMPVYGTVTAAEGELTIAMLTELKYDDPKWEDLLNQMTFEEQNWMGSYGLHYFAGAKSVGAPGGDSKDGPAGVKSKNPDGGAVFGFPSPVVMAATWNTELLEELGKAFGSEALHANVMLVYAPGANTHRSPYSGRNFEYYSEDGVLGGKILSAQVSGMQSRGIMVMTKHFAFNDHEVTRYGVATFLTEQSAREIYLRPFEIAVREAAMNGIMSAFNRLGCTWVGAHKGLLTDILRNEWGFLGIVETDSCTGDTFHMGHKYAKAEGLVAGNDMWMANGSTDYFAESKDNPTVMLALRQACRRILYTQLHSAAMNGMSTSTRIVQVTPWWQILLYVIMIVIGVTTLAFVAMAVLSFVYANKKVTGVCKSAAV